MIWSMPKDATIRVYRIAEHYNGEMYLETRDIRPEYMAHLAKSGWRDSLKHAQVALIDQMNQYHYKQLNLVWNVEE